jgi:hypothetical protein
MLIQIVFGSGFVSRPTLFPLEAPHSEVQVLFLGPKKLSFFSFHLFIQILNRCGSHKRQCFAREINLLTNKILPTIIAIHKGGGDEIYAGL